MQRYILDNETKDFYKSDIHHIKKVMRMKTGDQVITCLDSVCHISTLIVDDLVSFENIEMLESLKTPNITLIQGLLKGTKIETTIKYASIFGAKKLYLTSFERSIAKVKNTDNKVERFFAIAKEASELAHRESIPQISMFESIKKINLTEFDVIILADEEEVFNKSKDLITKELKEKNIAIVVGPEGGISKNEREYLKSMGCITISLGKYIFPAEIAAISVLNDFIY